jgi:ATP-dependent DNA ligase
MPYGTANGNRDRQSAKKIPPILDLESLPKARVGFMEPMLARSVSELPANVKDWLYEIKLDGYRCLVGESSNKVRLWSRRGNTFTKQFPPIAQACNGLEPDTLIDGEIVAVDNDGRVSFNLLQHHRSKAQAIQYYAFDLLVYKGRSLTGVPLQTRRQLLKEALSAVGDPIRLS